MDESLNILKKKLNELINNNIKNDMSNITCSYYPYATSNKNIYEASKIDNNKIDKINKILSHNKTNKNNVNEDNYRDLQKLTIKNKSKELTYYLKKRSNMIELKTGFAIISYFKKIEESNFPILNKYNYTTNYDQVLYEFENYDFVMRKYDDSKWIICVNFTVSNKIDATLKKINATLNKIDKNID